MKRILLTALLLALAFAAAGVAEPSAPESAAPSAPTAAPENAFDTAGAPYAGTWVPFEDGFALYLPSDWTCRDMDEEQAGSGLFYRAGNEVGDGGTAMGVAVGYMPVDGLETMTDLLRDFARAGFTGLRQRRRNGMSALAFVGPKGDYRGVAFYHPEYPGYAMIVYVTPVGAAGSAEEAVGRAILDSLSPWRMEEAGE